MAVPGLGRKGHDLEVNQAGGHQLDRNDLYPPTAADFECQSTLGASFCDLTPVEAEYDSARWHEGSAMEIRDLTSFSRGQRASRPYPEPVATAEGMIQWIRQTTLRSNGATCYLNSVVTA